MRITYKTTLIDVASFIWYHNTRSPLFLGLTSLPSIVFAWNIAQEVLKQTGRVASVVAFIFVCATTFSIMFLFGFLCSCLASLSRKNKTFMTENTFEFLGDHFTTENQYGRSEYRWTIVQSLYRTRRHIFVYIAQTKAIVIPRRAFQNTQEWNVFFDLLRHNRGRP